jgi:sialate O-acetylesterase
MKTTKLPRITAIVIFLLSLIPGLRAEVTMPRIISDHMLLQRNQPVKIWGWADKGEKVTVAFIDQKVSVRAGKDGRWEVALEPMEAGGPYVLTVRGKDNSLVRKDVLVGDVWICSGQSNMEFALANVNKGE